jgi:endonuclease III
VAKKKAAASKKRVHKPAAKPGKTRSVKQASKAGRAATKPVRLAENPAELRRRASEILRLLRDEFSGAKTALHFQTPYQLLVATILSAQCTDERVNIVTNDLFAKYPHVQDLAAISQPELEKIIHSAGFFRMKAKNIIACSKGLMEKFGGEVPARLEDLVQLAGVGRKTANVVLGQAFNIASGVVVDTHVHRLSNRFGLSTQNTPEQIEQDLMRLYPEGDWIDIGSVFILHGRKTCKARGPLCGACRIAHICPSALPAQP